MIKSGVTLKEGYFSFVLFMSLLIVVAVVVLFPPIVALCTLNSDTQQHGSAKDFTERTYAA